MATTLEQAVKDFKEMRKQNAAFIARIQRVPMTMADARLFVAANRRLKAQQVERRTQAQVAA